MQQTLLKCLVLLALVFATTVSFADSVSIQSIEDGLKAREIAIKPKAGAGIGNDTYIMVINYTPGDIWVTFPNNPKMKLTNRTSIKYQKPNYTGNTWIQIQRPDGSSWDKAVNYQDIVSVYENQIYVTH